MTNKPPFVVIMNGPPGSGKDAAASYLSLCEFDGKHVNHVEMKHQLIALTKLIWNISDEEWANLSARENKETPSSLFGGMSPRQALIHTSEKVIKPAYGEDYFGKAAARSLAEGEHHVFSDGGFVSEIFPIIDKVGKENVLVIRIRREGCDFSNDSRNYLPDWIDVSFVDMDNNGTLIDFYKNIKDIVCRWNNAR